MSKRNLFIPLCIFLLSATKTVTAATIVDVHKDGYLNDFTRSTIISPDGIADEIRDTNALLSSRGIFGNFNVDSRIIMTFDILPYASKHLTSAFLTGYGTRVDTRGSLDPISGEFYLYSGDGLVGLNDFDLPATYLGIVNFQADPAGFNLSPFQLNVTSSLQHLLNNSDHYAEFRIKTNSPTIFINAGEVDPSSFFTVNTLYPGPKLALTLSEPLVTPEPSFMVLFGIGSIFMGKTFLRRKKANQRSRHDFTN